MPERDRRLVRVLTSCAIAATVTFAAMPAANAAQQPTSPTSPSRGSTSSSGKPTGSTKSSTKSSDKQADEQSDGGRATSCTATAVPPPANEGSGDQMPPLDLPDQPIGGERMGECQLVLPRNAPPLPDRLTAGSWLIADQDTGDVLAAFAPHARQRPAGTIKVLLALVALEGIEPDRIIAATKEDTKQTGTRVGLVADGKYEAGDLIRALIAMPAADAANALARELGGIDATVQKMNDLAHKLNAMDTRVVNPNGNDVPGQSTSAFDTALIYREAMRNPAFADATGSKKVELKPQGARNTKISRTNDNKLLDSYKGATGGKAGNTSAALNTFVGSAEKDGRHLIVSVMHAEKPPFDVASSLLDYGFTLASSRVTPVGMLGVKGAQTTTSSGETTSTGAAGPDKKRNQGSSTQAIQRSAFGTFGLPVTILAGVVVLLGLLMTMRRKMARAKRLRAQQAR